MELYQSRNNHLSCVLSDKDGNARYMIKTPGLPIRKTTTIHKISDQSALTYKSQLAQGEEVGEDWDLQEEEFARIHWFLLKSSKLIYNGAIHEINEYMPRTAFMSMNRTFTGPDGLTYTWRMGVTTSHLELNSTPPETIARTNPHTHFSETRAFLEITPKGMHMVDLIVITKLGPA